MLKNALKLLCRISLEEKLAIQIDNTIFWVTNNFEFLVKDVYSWSEPSEKYIGLSEHNSIDENTETMAEWLHDNYSSGSSIEFTRVPTKRTVTKEVWE